MIQTFIGSIAQIANSAAERALNDTPEDDIYGPAAWDRFFAELHETAIAQAHEESPAAFSVGPDYLQPSLDDRG